MMLSDRKRQILKAVIDDYIQTAEPVGSKAVVLKLPTAVSSATVRNEMAELENMGYLEQPHTSAGRIPSSLGYRLYVDELMGRYRMTSVDIAEVQKALAFRVRELDSLIIEAGRLVSEMTKYTTITVTPAMEQESVRRFEIIRVDANTVVLVLVTNSDQIKNKICRLNMPLSDMEIAVASRALNSYFTNIPLRDMNEQRITEAEFATGAEITELLVAAIDFASEVLERILKRDTYLAGASRMLQFPEYRDVDKARELLDVLSDRESLEKLPMPDGNEVVRVSIGRETGLDALEDAGMVFASYEAGHGAKGMIGVVGPMRMDYARICARLTRFTKGLSEYLNQQQGTERR